MPFRIMVFGLPVAIFAAVTLVGLVLVWSMETNFRQEQRVNLENTASAQAAIIERQLQRSMTSAYMMGHFIGDSADNIPRFAAYADLLIKEFGGIANLVFIEPGGQIHTYPPMDAARASRITSLLKPSMTGALGGLKILAPLKIDEDGTYILGTYILGNSPILTAQSEGSSTAETGSAGSVSTLLRLSTFLANTGLSALGEKNFRYLLWHRDALGRNKVTLASHQGTELTMPVASAPIKMADQEWFLELSYDNPPGFSGNFWYDVVLTVSTALLISLFSYLLLRLPGQLKEQVEEKTRELEELAFYDTLTGLPNRKLFQDRLSQAIRRHSRSHRSFALLFLDLDEFKTINDTLGHEQGDTLLIEVARRLSDSVRKSDTVARLGGDEFTIILNDLDPGDQGLRLSAITHIIAKVLASVNEPVQIAKTTLTAGSSIGVTFFPDDGTDADRLLRNADLAMYKAKREGKNTYQFFSEDLNTRAQNRLSLEQELRLAVGENQLFVAYQPIYPLDGGRPVAVEALLRWRHPLRGVISAAQFIETAEAAGLMSEAGRFVIEQGCSDLARLNNLKPGNGLRVHFNLSPREFRQADIDRQILMAAASAGISGKDIGIELAEAALMDNPDTAIEVIKRLRAQGVTVAIDDFGTGYSSLSMLRTLPMDMLKIDRTFIKELEGSEDDRNIVSTIIAMAHKLNLKVVAEGVETPAQEALLGANQCDLLQGYIRCAPLPFEELIELLDVNGS